MSACGSQRAIPPWMASSVALPLVFLRQGLLLIPELISLAGLVVYKPWLSLYLIFYRDGTTDIVHYSQVLQQCWRLNPGCELFADYHSTYNIPPSWGGGGVCSRKKVWM